MADEIGMVERIIGVDKSSGRDYSVWTEMERRDGAWHVVRALTDVSSIDSALSEDKP